MRAVTGVLVALHVVAAIVGFGAVAVTGVMAAVAARDPRSPAAVRYFRPAPNWPSYLVLLVPVFGAGLEASSGRADVHFAWPWIALGIWGVAVAAGAVHWPAERRLQALLCTGAGSQPASDKTVLGSAGTAGASQPASDKTVLGSAATHPPPAPGPAGSTVGRLRRVGPDTDDALRRTCVGVMWSSGVMTVCFVAALVVMVVQPR